jgi:hypothetical protein
MVADENQAQVAAVNGGVQNLQEAAAVALVEALARFVQDEKTRALYKGAREQDEALVTQGQAGKRSGGMFGKVQLTELIQCQAALARRAMLVEPKRIKKA